MENKTSRGGGDFIIYETDFNTVFIPEDFTADEKMMGDTCMDFVKQNVWPQVEKIDAQEKDLMPTLLKKAGELGILGASIPEELNGLGLRFPVTMLMAEALGAGYSFSVACTAHTGIGTLPILYYGNETQKNKYIPDLATGARLSAYCLTEPSSGSDANAAKTTAQLSADGKHYILNGQKMWITNAGFAAIFTVFAKIDGDDTLSAFIVERDYPGVTINAEEKKMGIKGSSTCQVFFNEVKVPVENLLSTRKNGFKIALNILNIGRVKLGVAVLGAAKMAIDLSIKYALEREQFGRPIAKYNAIKNKIARQIFLSYALESAVYRIAYDIEAAILELEQSGKYNKQEALLKGIERFAPECAMMKVFGSEVLDFVVDEGVQIHGGMGYSSESLIEKAYRDARINRIFEGTNEINRMLIVDMVLKRALKGELDLLTPAQAVVKELMGIPAVSPAPKNLFEKYLQLVKQLKKAVLLIAGSAVQKLADQLQKEQEILMIVADLCTQLYVLESLLLRVQKLQSQNESRHLELQWAMVEVFAQETADLFDQKGKIALSHILQNDELKMMLMGLKRFVKIDPVDSIVLQRKIADFALEQKKYPF